MSFEPARKNSELEVGRLYFRIFRFFCHWLVRQIAAKLKYKGFSERPRCQAIALELRCNLNRTQLVGYNGKVNTIYFELLHIFSPFSVFK